MLRRFTSLRPQHTAQGRPVRWSCPELVPDDSLDMASHLRNDVYAVSKRSVKTHLQGNAASHVKHFCLQSALPTQAAFRFTVLRR